MFIAVLVKLQLWTQVQIPASLHTYCVISDKSPHLSEQDAKLYLQNRANGVISSFVNTGQEALCRVNGLPMSLLMLPPQSRCPAYTSLSVCPACRRPSCFRSLDALFSQPGLPSRSLPGDTPRETRIVSVPPFIALVRRAT